jgi:hypothetical protein
MSLVEAPLIRDGKRKPQRHKEQKDSLCPFYLCGFISIPYILQVVTLWINYQKESHIEWF